MPNTVLRQAFLLSQYSFICEQYFKCSNTQYTQYFLTAGKQNSLLFQQHYLYWRKLVPKKFVQKWQRSY